MRQKIIDILMDFNDTVDYDSEQRLIDDGLIDSLDLTALLVELEQAFGVGIGAGRIVPENFNSVDAILAMIRDCQAKP